MPTPMPVRVERNRIKRERDRIAVSIFDQKSAFLHKLCGEEIERILNSEDDMTLEKQSRLRHCTKIREEIVRFDNYFSENKSEKSSDSLGRREAS